ncbi:hypothetical protein NQ318_003771 [Aromia moschata]|uniref:ABC transporter domain-containing protein n=1 Tax=Aromia moschata TaxID=1265417 RepID=A0AAV8YHC5_9CUCU|nr:hypothetical protein NQ318_003771 [Aromia moschata]
MTYRFFTRYMNLKMKASSVSSSLVGLAISQSLILTGMLQYGMRQTAEVVNQLTSVERVLQYTTIEKEGPFDTPEDKMPALPWPDNGLIEFRNLSLIGIVGRTGAGKSSLISALFRLAPLEGNIFIDRVDTKQMGLTDLRNKISIIPQEPVLFSATLRYNLDPFNEFQDDVLWSALEENLPPRSPLLLTAWVSVLPTQAFRSGTVCLSPVLEIACLVHSHRSARPSVELKGVVSDLDFMVSDGGNNFSLGQRQLVCLARAVLRKIRSWCWMRLLQMTDSFIQDTIRQKFKHCTVLTIAHRLNTIMDSDRVLVMDAGLVVEFDHPHRLLQIPDGHFHKMVLETGPTMSLQLKDIALEAFKEKYDDVTITKL